MKETVTMSTKEANRFANGANSTRRQSISDVQTFFKTVSHGNNIPSFISSLNIPKMKNVY